MQRLDDMAFRTLYSSASSASAASKQLLEHGLSKLKAGRAKKNDLPIMLERTFKEKGVKIQQLAVSFKLFRVNLESAMCQPCSSLGSQDPTVGTCVPPDSGIP